jgi:hypothetical protein
MFPHNLRAFLHGQVDIVACIITTVSAHSKSYVLSAGVWDLSLWLFEQDNERHRLIESCSPWELSVADIQSKHHVW